MAGRREKERAAYLINHEINERNAEEAACEPDEKDFGLEVCVSGTIIDEIGR
jgi:hypothetical protein